MPDTIWTLTNRRLHLLQDRIVMVFKRATSIVSFHSKD